MDIFPRSRIWGDCPLRLQLVQMASTKTSKRHCLNMHRKKSSCTTLTAPSCSRIWYFCVIIRSFQEPTNKSDPSVVSRSLDHTTPYYPSSQVQSWFYTSHTIRKASTSSPSMPNYFRSAHISQDSLCCSTYCFPVHDLPPALKVKNSLFISIEASGSSHLSGTNSSPSWTTWGFNWWTLHAWQLTIVPPGTKNPSMTRPPCGTTLGCDIGIGGKNRRPSLMTASR